MRDGERQRADALAYATESRSKKSAGTRRSSAGWLPIQDRDKLARPIIDSDVLANLRVANR